MTGPTAIATARLQLRPPQQGDLSSIFAYASDPEVTRYMSWPTHRSEEDTRRYLAIVEDEWAAAGIGAYLVVCDGVVIGSTGIHRRSAEVAEIGYALRRDDWGRGYATEACAAMLALGQRLGFARIEARVHVDHRASARVLEKVGMAFESMLRHQGIFPNLDSSPQDVRSYAWVRAR